MVATGLFTPFFWNAIQVSDLETLSGLAGGGSELDPADPRPPVPFDPDQDWPQGQGRRPKLRDEVAVRPGTHCADPLREAERRSGEGRLPHWYRLFKEVRPLWRSGPSRTDSGVDA